MRPLALFLIIINCAPAYAHDVPQEIQSIYWSDGDSGWINGKKDGFAFRLNDLDAPGTRAPEAKCEAAIALVYEAKAFAVEATRHASQLSITHFEGHDRYERHIIDLSVSEKDLGEMGIEAGHYGSWPHKGSKALAPRPVWCI